MSLVAKTLCLDPNSRGTCPCISAVHHGHTGTGRVGQDLQFCNCLELAFTRASTENKLVIRRSRIWRLRECASSSPIFLVSLASSFRSSSWATFRSSFVHSSKYFSCTVLPTGPSTMFVSLRLNSGANFSFVVCLWPGCLLKSSHASSSFSWKRCFSSALNRKCYRLCRTSSDVISASRRRVCVSSFPVALT